MLFMTKKIQLSDKINLSIGAKLLIIMKFLFIKIYNEDDRII